MKYDILEYENEHDYKVVVRRELAGETWLRVRWAVSQKRWYVETGEAVATTLVPETLARYGLPEATATTLINTVLNKVVGLRRFYPDITADQALLGLRTYMPWGACDEVYRRFKSPILSFNSDPERIIASIGGHDVFEISKHGYDPCCAEASDSLADAFKWLPDDSEKQRCAQAIKAWAEEAALEELPHDAHVFVREWATKGKAFEAVKHPKSFELLAAPKAPDNEYYVTVVPAYARPTGFAILRDNRTVVHVDEQLKVTTDLPAGEGFEAFTTHVLSHANGEATLRHVAKALADWLSSADLRFFSPAIGDFARLCVFTRTYGAALDVSIPSSVSRRTYVYVNAVRRFTIEANGIVTSEGCFPSRRSTFFDALDCIERFALYPRTAKQMLCDALAQHSESLATSSEPEAAATLNYINSYLGKPQEKKESTPMAITTNIADVNKLVKGSECSPAARAFSRVKTAAAHGAKVGVADTAADALLEGAKELFGDTPVVQLAMSSEQGRAGFKLLMASVVIAGAEAGVLPVEDGTEQFVVAGSELVIEAASRDLVQGNLEKLRPALAKLVRAGKQALKAGEGA